MKWTITILLAIWPAVSMAEDAPCRHDGDTVVCQKAGFEILVGKLVSATAERDKLAVRLDAVTGDLGDARGALDACLAKPPPEPVVIKPTTMQRMGPMVLGILGAGVLGVTSMMDGATTGRAIGAVVGFLSVGAGLYWAVP